MKHISIIGLAALLSLAIISCNKKAEQTAVIDVIAKDFSFAMPDSIPSGWNTFRFHNQGHSVHFFLFMKYPDSVTYDQYVNEVAKTFDVVFDSLKAGESKADAMNLLVQMLPGWFTEIVAMGGAGIIDMGKSSDVTMNLTPGHYEIECYIKEQGVFHTALGMTRPFVVTGKPSGQKPPIANVNLTLTNSSIESEGAVQQGLNTFAVHFSEQPVAGLGNDVHIIRLDEGVELDSVVSWLDWTNIPGLQNPAPAHFYGGAQEMPVGATEYFTAELEPGEYAFVAEPNAANGLVKRFTVK